MAIGSSSSSRTPAVPMSLCGASVELSKSAWRYSTAISMTIGGVILIDDEPFALTAAQHFLPPRAESSRATTKSCLCEVRGSGKHPNWITHKTEKNTPDQHDPPQRNSAAISENAEFIVSSREWPNINNRLRLADREPPNKENATTTRAAFVNFDYNWAVLELDISPEQMLNVAPPPEEGGDLIVTDVRPASEVLRSDWDENSHFESADVVVATSRGEVGSMYDDQYVYMNLAGAGAECRSNALIMEVDDYEVGDEGSWVVDSESGELVAILVGKGCDERFFALPAWYGFENIRKTFGASSVTLPQESDDDDDDDDDDDEDGGDDGDSDDDDEY